MGDGTPETGRPVKADAKAASAARRPASPAKVAQAEDSHAVRMRAKARDRLDELLADALSRRFYGRVCVEVAFENGRPTVIHRRIEGTDKP